MTPGGGGPEPRDVVVVGAGAAGLTAAETLRRHGYDGRLTLIGAEAHPPYDRPPLSKQILAGTWEPSRLPLRTGTDLAALHAEIRLGTRVTGLDPAAGRLRLDDGGTLGYDGLVIATGVVPRRMPRGHDLAGVHTLRTLDDALALRRDLVAGPRLVVIGAGFLGAEVAAVARGLGVHVTLVDPLPAPMIRQVGPVIGAAVARLHADHGTRLRTGVGVDEIVGSGGVRSGNGAGGGTGRGGRVVAVRLGDGELLPADTVLVAIGSVPATGWLGGLPVGDGVHGDAYCRVEPVAAEGTGTRRIVAAGDVASWLGPGGRRVRVEHRMNATEQGIAAAEALLGIGSPYTPVPYFWSDQYGTRIQVYGQVPPGAATVLLGADGPGGFTALYTSDGRVVGALGWNAPRQVRALRAHVLAGTPAAELTHTGLTQP